MEKQFIIQTLDKKNAQEVIRLTKSTKLTEFTPAMLTAILSNQNMIYGELVKIRLMIENLKK